MQGYFGDSGQARTLPRPTEWKRQFRLYFMSTETDKLHFFKYAYHGANWYKSTNELLTEEEYTMRKIAGTLG